jgi:hypothetical protein
VGFEGVRGNGGLKTCVVLGEWLGGLRDVVDACLLERDVVSEKLLWRANEPNRRCNGTAQYVVKWCSTWSSCGST